jgi:hypothetical protein
MNFLKKEVGTEESRLNSVSQQKIASLVKSLPSEDLSMSWRSELNVKLIAAREAKIKKRSAQRVLTWGASLSCGLAVTVLGVMMFGNKPVVQQTSKVDSPTLASELVQTHQESMVLASVSGTGAAARETSILEDSYTPQDDLL